VRNPLRVRKKSFEVCAEFLGGVDVIGNVQGLQRRAVPLEKGFVENKFVGQSVAGLFGSSIEVVADNFCVINYGEP
jgi:hypothetical protein